MKKLVSLFIAVVTLSIMIAGCGTAQKNAASDSTQKKVETSVAPTTEPVKKLEGKIVFATNLTNKADSTLTDLAKEFMNANPGVTVEIEGVKDPEQVLKTRMAAGELPDVSLVVASLSKSDFSKYFVPIDDLGFTDDNMYMLSAGRGDDGKLYTLNGDVNYNGIIYNKNAFQAAGITDIPKTLDEFYADCEKLKSKGITPLAADTKDLWPLYNFSGANDAEIPEVTHGDANIWNNLKNQDTLFSDDNSLLSGFKILRTMKDKGYLESDLVSYNWDKLRRDHATGKVAMVYLGTWYPASMLDVGAKPGDAGMFPFPGSKILLQTGDYRYGVSKNSKYIDTAKAFLKWMWEQDRFVKAVGFISTLKSSKNTDPSFAGLQSTNLPVVPVPDGDQVTKKIFNEGKIDLNAILQEYLLSDKPDDVLKKANDKWLQAKKTVMGQ